MNHSKVDPLFLLPLVFIFIVPFILKANVVFLNGEYFEYWNGSFFNIEIYSFYKAVILIFTSIVMILFFVFALYKKHQCFKFSIEILMLVIIIIILVISATQSELKVIPFFGMVERYEGLFIILSYFITCIYVITFLKSEKSVWVIILLYASVTIGFVFLGGLQFFGEFDDFFDILFKWVVPSDFIIDRDIFGFRKGSVSLTMYNSNNAGLFSSLVFSLFTVLYFSARKMLVIRGSFFISLLSFFLLIVTKSRAAFVGSIVSVFIVVVLYYTVNKSRAISFRKSIILIAYLLIFTFTNAYSGGSLSNKVTTLDPRYESEILARDAYINDIILSSNEVEISYNNQILSIFWIEDKLNFMIDDTNQIIYRDREKLLVGYDNEISFSTRIVSDIPILDLNLKGITMIFAKYPDTIKIVGARNVFYDKIIRSETAIPFLRDSFGSYRGYIWKKTIPLIKENFWIGNGPDTLAAYFPHYDVISMLNAFGRTNMIVDKPHNYYLQVAHDTGVLSLIMLLTLFGYYFIQSIILQFRVSIDSELKSISLAILAGVIGYLVAAIFVDSTVHVAPLFWVLLGTGFAANRLLIENK